MLRSPHPTTRLALTALDDRCLPSLFVTASVVNGDLVIEGSQYSDTVELRVVGTPPPPGDLSPPDPADQVRVWANNAYVGLAINYEEIRHGEVIFRGNEGNDSFRVTRDTAASDDVLYITLHVSGNAGADTLSGSEGNDFLKGDDRTTAQVYDDTLYGNGGHDELFGLNGADKLHGGEGDDELWGYMRTVSGSIEGSLYDKGDTLYGDGGWDELWGQYKNDTLYGGEGNDVAYGGDGDDRIRGGGGSDRLLGHAGNDTVLGDGGLDFVYGDGPPNTVNPSDGNDWLDGGWDGSRDELYGGGGADTFVRTPPIAPPWGNEDLFLDFLNGTDVTRVGPFLYTW